MSLVNEVASFIHCVKKKYDNKYVQLELQFKASISALGFQYTRNVEVDEVLRQCTLKQQSLSSEE